MTLDTGANGQGAGTGGDSAAGGDGGGNAAGADQGAAGANLGGLSDVIDSLGDGTAGTQPIAAGNNAEIFASITDKSLLNSPALQGITDINGLVNKVVELNALQPQDAVRIPGPNSTPEEINAFYAKLGRPESADKYELDPAKGLSEGLQVDPKMKSWFEETAFKRGLTKEQASAMVQDWNTFMNEGAKEYASQFEHDAQSAINALKTEYGATLKPKMQAGHQIIKELGGDGMIELMNSPFVGNNPNIMRFVVKLGEALGDGRVITDGVPQGSNLMAPAEARAEANRIIGEVGADGKRGAYWDKTHPAHKDTVEKVARLFAMAEVK